MPALKFLTAFIFSVLTLCVQANIDSLKAIVSSNSNPNVRALASMKLGAKLEAVNADSALFYYNLALKLAKSDTLVGKIYGNMAFYYMYTKGSIDSTEWAVKKSIEYYNKVDFYEGSGYAFFNLGVFLFESEAYEQAIEALIEGLFYAEKDKNGVLLGTIYNNLGLAYQYQGYYNLAIQNYLEAYKYIEYLPETNALNLKFNLALNYFFASRWNEALNELQNLVSLNFSSLNNEQYLLANLNIFQCYLNIHKIDSAKIYLDKAEAFLVTNPNNYYKNQLIYNKAKYYEAIGEPALAKNLINTALNDSSLSLKNRLRVSLILLYGKLQLSYSPLTKNELTQLEQLLLEAYNNATELELLENKLSLNELLIQLYAQLNQPQLVSSYAQKLIVLSDSVQSANQIQAVTEAQVKYKSDLLAVEVSNLSQQNKIKEENLQQAQRIQTSQWIIILLFAVGLAVVIILWQKIKRTSNELSQSNEQLKVQNEFIAKQNTEKELLLQEVHHRVKNNLQIISSLLDLQSRNSNIEEVKHAILQSKNRITSMALIHQMLYQSNQFDAINTKEYLQQLCNSILSLSNNSSVKFNVELNNNIGFSVSTCIPIGLITTELLTNSIKHAFKNTSTPQVLIKINQLNNQDYSFEYIDNGIGLPEQFDIKKSKSLGMRLIHKLAGQLNGNLKYEYLNGSTFTFTFNNID